MMLKGVIKMKITREMKIFATMFLLMAQDS